MIWTLQTNSRTTITEIPRIRRHRAVRIRRGHVRDRADAGRAAPCAARGGRRGGTDDRGTPITEYTVLAFSQDEALWRAQSRQIMTTRPDQNGKYQLRGLPPGRYYVVAVDPAEQGEWFEPAYLTAHVSGATSVLLAEGE